MNNEEMEKFVEIAKKEKLALAQMFFLKSFIISFIFLILATALCIYMHGFQLEFINKYFPMDVKDYNHLVVLLLGMWKILIFQFTLVPAIVIWLMRKCSKCGCE